MHQFCNKSKMSNMRNETQMIKHFTCFRSSEKMSNYSNSATTRFIVKNSLFVPIYREVKIHLKYSLLNH